MSTSTIADSDRLGYITQQQLTEGRARDFTRFVSCLIAKDGSYFKAVHLFQQRYPRSLSADLFTKAAVSAATTIDSTWAAPLAPLRPLADAFISLLRPRTLLGRIPGLRQVPFNVSVNSQTGGGTYAWVGQGAPAPATSAAFAATTLGIAKAAGIIVITEELGKLSTPSAEVVMRDELIQGTAQFLDTQFVDPAVAAVANVSPASVTNGTVAIISAGTSGANALTDLQALLNAFITANPNVENLALLMKPSNAIAISRAANAPSLGMTGGSIYGIPVIASGNVGDRLIALDAAGILYADEGDTAIDASRNATVEMQTTPADPGTATTVLESMWARNLVALKIVRLVNWKRTVLSAVKYVSGASYV